MTFKFSITISACVFILFGCKKTPINDGYSKEQLDGIPTSLNPIPVEPDFSESRNWALIGETDGSASELGADVFYIYPTMYDTGMPWVASIEDQDLNREIDLWPIKHQASVFIGAGRVFAPRYRQAHYRVFVVENSLCRPAIELAYEDVKSAFVYWLDNFDEGRPIIIAGHSQGTLLARLLLQEFFDDAELGERLVAAYLPGFDIYESDFKTIKNCKSNNDTNCYCSWRTFATGYIPDWYKNELARNGEGNFASCINPISWSCESDVSDKKEHLGILTDKYKFKYEQTLTARVHGGILWLDKPHIIGGAFIHQNNWHVGDYNLFWENIRVNVRERILSF
jgi:hypothetical protein